MHFSTTAGCARSRRRRARTSASSAVCRPTPGSTSSASSSRRTARSSNGKVTGEIVYMAADEEENYVVAQANTPINADGSFKDERVLVRRSPQAASLEDLRKMLEAESFFGATTDIGYVPPTEVDYMDVAQADRLGRHGADPVPRARRRQPARWAPTCRSRPCRCCAPRRRTSAPASRTAPRVTPPT